MARFDLDPRRLNFTLERKGKEYTLRVLQRAAGIFKTMLGLLPSNYVSTVQGPNYTLELKAVAVELAKIELEIEDVDLDRDFNRTRSEFLYSIIGYLVFLNGRLPALEFNDEEFRAFLTNLIGIYFQGSVPDSITDAAGLFLETGTYELVENFLLTRAGASGYDISDQFGFVVNIDTGGAFPANLFEIQQSLTLILNIIRPAHTLFRIRYVFEDDYNPNDTQGDGTGTILDAYRWRLASYYYEDFRSYWRGIRDRDRLGKKINQVVTDEDHGADF